jgi:hypothetical protein
MCHVRINGFIGCGHGKLEIEGCHKIGGVVEDPPDVYVMTQWDDVDKLATDLFKPKPHRETIRCLGERGFRVFTKREVTPTHETACQKEGICSGKTDNGMSFWKHNKRVLIIYHNGTIVKLD